MIKLFHCADLHLSVAEKDYSLNVLKEIVDKAKSDNVDYLLFCGDMFDSFVDAEALRSDFRDILSSLKNGKVFYLPGNHEDRSKGSNQLSGLNLGVGKEGLLYETPYKLIKRDGIEFLSIPHQKDYSTYTEWPVPPKESSVRIAIAHGTVPDLTYSGPEEEDDGSVLDRDIFERYGVDYAALGHVHSRRTQKIGNVTYAYPGSARVWRLHEREMGPRGINLVEIGTDGNIACEFVPLESAGEYRRFTIPLSLEGNICIDEIAREWGENDAIELEMTGIVEDENRVAGLATSLETTYGPRVRSFKVKRDSVEVMAGIASQPIAKKFLELWEEKKPASNEGDIKVWMRARELALKAIRAEMQGGSK